MYQQEIQFFWPLTEQIYLDLDFTPSLEYIKEKQNRELQNSVTSGWIVGNGISCATVTSQILPTSFQFKPDGGSVGAWEVSEKVFFHRPKKPKAIVRFMSKLLLGWKWTDK
jgi:hypothetical protein